MQITQLATAEAYVERLRQDPQEVGALFRDLLINVTSFFRDSEAFDSLARLVTVAGGAACEQHVVDILRSCDAWRLVR